MDFYSCHRTISDIADLWYCVPDYEQQQDLKRSKFKFSFEKYTIVKIQTNIFLLAITMGYIHRLERSHCQLKSVFQSKRRVKLKHISERFAIQLTLAATLPGGYQCPGKRTYNKVIRKTGDLLVFNFFFQCQQHKNYHNWYMDQYF